VPVFGRPLLLLIIAIVTMLAGRIAAWKWGVGGLLILGGVAFFAAVNHGVNLNVVFGLMAVGPWGCGNSFGKTSKLNEPSCPSPTEPSARSCL
jgi:hypothetical protein